MQVVICSAMFSIFKFHMVLNQHLIFYLGGKILHQVNVLDFKSMFTIARFNILQYNFFFLKRKFTITYHLPYSSLCPLVAVIFASRFVMCVSFSFYNLKQNSASFGSHPTRAGIKNIGSGGSRISKTPPTSTIGPTNALQSYNDLSDATKRFSWSRVMDLIDFSGHESIQKSHKREMEKVSVGHRISRKASVKAGYFHLSRQIKL